MADWICAELGAFDAASLLDVGCGGGMLLEAFRKARPSLHYEGIDPSIENSEKARARGFAVTTGFIPIAKPQRREYDIVLASNVLSHIADPTAFLAAMASMTSESGRVVLYSHDGVEAGADHLWADVEFSFCREHLGALASKAGLELLKSRGVVAPLGQEDKHVLVFRRAASPREVSLLSDSARQELIQSRRHYFDAWRQLAIRLAAHVDRATGPVFNFGASFWSMLLAAYCPDYWRRVDSCIVDLGEGQFLEKPLLPTDQMPTTVRPLIVLGTNPRIQAQLKARLSDRADIVSWEDLIAR
jgi:trans-aconitate methyltransferase